MESFCKPAKWKFLSSRTTYGTLYGPWRVTTALARLLFLNYPVVCRKVHRVCFRPFRPVSKQILGLFRNTKQQNTKQKTVLQQPSPIVFQLQYPLFWTVFDRFQVCFETVQNRKRVETWGLWTCSGCTQLLRLHQQRGAPGQGTACMDVWMHGS